MTSSNGAGAGTSSQAPTGHTESPPARVYRLHFSRNWISRSGPKQGRQTVLVFTLGKAGPVEFVVRELAPDCRRIGRFRVAGHEGVNRVHFRGRLGRRVLGPGTYRIRARTLPRGRALVDTKLVIVTRPERDEIASARGANACGSNAQGHSSAASASWTASGAAPTTPSSGTAPFSEGKAEKPASPSRAHGVLGARFTRAVDAVTGIPLWLFILLGLAIAILAVAALPLRAARNRRAASALAQHRGVFALAGAVVLLAVTVAYTLH